MSSVRYEFTGQNFVPIFQKEYHIMLEDRELTHNINMHTFWCFAWSEEEAIGKMFINRPEFKYRNIESITIV